MTPCSTNLLCRKTGIDKQRKRQNQRLALWASRQVGHPYVWIYHHDHATRLKRNTDGTRAQPVRGEKNQETGDLHLTLRFGRSKYNMALHGHVHVKQDPTTGEFGLLDHRVHCDADDASNTFELYEYGNKSRFARPHVECRRDIGYRRHVLPSPGARHQEG